MQFGLCSALTIKFSIDISPKSANTRSFAFFAQWLPANKMNSEGSGWTALEKLRTKNLETNC